MLEFNGSSYIGWRLTSIATLRASGWDPRAYQEAYPKRMVELVRWLVNPGDERLTYDLRILVEPNPDRYTAGNVTFALLCRIDPGAGVRPVEHASIVNLKLAADFPDQYRFEIMSSEETRLLLSPFIVLDAVGIRRRTSWESLDTIRPASRLPRHQHVGFGPESGSQTAESGSRDDARILHAFEFEPEFGSLSPLMGLLLRLMYPTVVSVRIRPTRLRGGEARFIEDQIAICERYGQFRPEFTTIPADLRPTLSDQARGYRGLLETQLDGLRDDAAVMTITIAAPTGIPMPVVDTLGAWVTGPAGGVVQNIDPIRHLSGGYDVVAACPADLEAIGTLDISSPTDTPGEAGRLPYLFDSVAAAAAMRLPPLEDRPIPGFPMRDWKLLIPPPGFPTEGVLIGRTVTPDLHQPIHIAPEDRLLHTYVVGRTGTGKTTLLATMILDDIKRGEGVCVIDPHGDLVNEVVGKIPKGRVDDVILFDPNDTERPIGFNPLDWDTLDERDRVIGEVQAAVLRYITDDYGSSASEMAGPVFMDLLDFGLRIVTSDPDRPGTLPQLYALFSDSEFWERWNPPRIDDPLLASRIADFEKTQMQGARGGDISVGGYVRSKFTEFSNIVALRNIIGQPRSTIDFRRAMDEQKIVLVNLGIGETDRNPLSPRHARLLGMLLLAAIYSAAKERTAGARAPFHLYVDEFQNLATATFADMVSEVRKFGVGLVLANQYLTQIKDPQIREALFGNVETMVVFPVGRSDARELEREMAPLTSADLVNLPVWHAYVRSPKRAPAPFVIASIQNDIRFLKTRAEKVRRASRARYGRRRSEVETEIAVSLSSPDEQSDGPVIKRRDISSSTGISRLSLGERSTGCLRRQGILTVGRLIKLTAADLLNITNFGRRSLEEVRAALRVHGLTLKGED